MVSFQPVLLQNVLQIGKANAVELDTPTRGYLEIQRPYALRRDSAGSSEMRQWFASRKKRGTSYSAHRRT
jgi:hypothetical protein